MNGQIVRRSFSSAFVLWALAAAVGSQALDFAFGSPVQARTLSVNADGTGDYQTLRAAITAAQAGDIIVLEQGTYFGFDNQDITFSGKNLTVRSQDPNNPTIVAQTTIDCQGDRTTWSTHWAVGAQGDGNTHLTLAGLTIANAFEISSGGAVRGEEADLDVINCTFTNNVSQMPGGAIFCSDNHARFVGCTFSNSASDTLHGGALYAKGSRLDFVNCSFRPSGGCAIETYDCQMTLTGCTFQNNQGQDGGAIYCRPIPVRSQPR